MRQKLFYQEFLNPLKILISFLLLPWQLFLPKVGWQLYFILEHEAGKIMDLQEAILFQYHRFPLYSLVLGAVTHRLKVQTDIQSQVGHKT